MEKIFYTIIGFIVLYILYVLARVILSVIFWLFFSLCAFIRKMIGGWGTWISGLIFPVVIILAILLPKPFPTNQQFSQVYATTLVILSIGSFLLWLFSLIGAYIRNDSELFEKLHATRDVVGLIKFMRDKTRPEEIRNAAIEVLANIGETAIEPLITALNENDADAAKALIKIGKPAVEPLIVGLKNGNHNAAWVLGEIGDNRAVEPLIVALKSENY